MKRICKRRIQKSICFVCMAILMCSGLFFNRPIDVQAKEEWPVGPEVTSDSAIVMDANTGTILYDKNMHDHHYPASITKIMTVMLALENSSLDETVTFSNDAVFKIDRDSSHISRDVGEQMTMEQTLYAIMLESANECAYAVAEHVGGSYQAFIDMMNAKAQELGCTDTHFNNPNGLPDEQHYTSCYDMALIANEAIKIPEFRKIISSPRYTIPPTNKHSEPTLLNNHHQMISQYKGAQNLYNYAIGGKTGYTVAAGNTLVTYAEKDGMLLTCVVMKSTDHYGDTRKLFDYCFSNFKDQNIAANESGDVGVATSADQMFGGSGNYVSISQDASITLPTGVEFYAAKSNVTTEDLPDNVIAAIDYTYADRPVGKATLTKNFQAIDAYKFNVEETEDESEMSFLDKAVNHLKKIQKSIMDSENEIEISKIDLIILGVAFAVALGVFIALIVMLRHAIRRNKRKRRRRKKQNQE